MLKMKSSRDRMWCGGWIEREMNTHCNIIYAYFGIAVVKCVYKSLISYGTFNNNKF